MRTLRRDVLLIAVVALFAGSFVVALVASGGSAPFRHGGDYDVRAMVPSAVSLGPGAEVRIAGVQVGRLDAIERRGRGAELQLRLGDDHAPIPADSTFAIRLRSLIGENYVELYPGRSRQELPDGGVLPATAQEHEYVELEQVLDLLKGDTRRRARALLRGAGAGLRGRGHDLNRTIGGASRVITGAEPVIKVLAQDRARVSRLVEQVGDVSRAIGERGDAIERLARQGRATALTLARSDAALRSTLTALPGALRQVRATSGVLRSVTRRSTPVVADLARAVEDLGPSIRRLGPAADQARGVLRALDTAAPPLRRTLGALRRASGPLANAMPELRQALCQLNPMVKRLAPYRDEAAGLLQNLGSVTSYYDATGHAGRLMALVGQYSFAPQPKPLDDGFKGLLDAGLLGADPGVGYDPFPAPGKDTRPAEGRGRDSVGDYDEPYERVMAEC